MADSNVPLPSVRPTRRRRALRWTLRGLALVLVLLLLAAGWVRIQLGRSLPQLDGDRAVAGLSAPVTVARDGLGVPTITGVTRQDVARALGFVHAQDRFFQMDLARRRSAGELSALIGAAALKLDTQTRVLGFRRRARTTLAQATADERALATAYAEGVNAGLAALGAVPPEYMALRTRPEPWAAEDCVLVLASMFMQLQDAFGVRETRIGLVHEVLPPPLADFVTSTVSDWETPLSGPARPSPEVPGAEVFDLRGAMRPAARQQQAPPDATRSAERPEDALLAMLGASAPERFGVWGSDDLPGSNNWSVSGAHTASRGAIVADDMHLGLGMPNIWYRASMAWTSPAAHHVTGVTLPGVPALVVGSNGNIAWGFTNTTADWTDIVLLEIDPANPSMYRTPSGWRAFETRKEEIAVAHGTPHALDVRETIWGPVIDPDARGRQRAIAWVPLRDGGMNLAVNGLESATTLEDAFGIGAQAGMPAQNLVVGERGGRIGWSVAGRIPRRVGFDGKVPTSWADGTRGWDGWLAPAEYPRVVEPASGRIVTANNRVVDLAELDKLGDGGYDPGARARQIADGLAQLENATPADMLKVQLDDRALFLERWRALLLQVLSDRQGASSEDRQRLRHVVDTTWTGRASVDSAAYRLVRDFRQRVGELVVTPLFAEVRKVDATYTATAGRLGEGPLWAMVSTRPPHLLSPEFATWEELLIAAADRTIVDAREASGSVEAHAWGRANTVRIQHPLSRAVPQLARWLDLPREELPGDSNMPRVQAPEFGASERMAVSPGRESEGYLHMPGGQSGHPLSPHYRDAHRAWVVGEPTPFLPGPTQHTLTLRP